VALSHRVWLNQERICLQIEPQARNIGSCSKQWVILSWVNVNMPLYDALGSSSFARLPKMNSVPSTDDLRYLVSEAKKRLGKPVELPFEHPTNRQTFIVKLVMSVGNRQPPSWTLLRK
jgi:hypothetical protein